MKKTTIKHHLGAMIAKDFKVPRTNKYGSLIKNRKLSKSDHAVYRKRSVKSLNELLENYVPTIRSESPLGRADSMEDHELSKSLSIMTSKASSNFSSQSAAKSKASIMMTQSDVHSLLASDRARTHREDSLSYSKAMDSYKASSANNISSASQSYSKNTMTDDNKANHSNLSQGTLDF